MNVLVMCSCGYGQTYSAINTKSEYISLGLRKAGCSVRILDSIEGGAGVAEFEEHISSAGIPYVSFPRSKYHWLASNMRLYKRLLLKYRKDGEINHIIIGMEYMPIFISLARYAKKAGYTTSTLFHEWHIGMHMRGIKTLHKYWQDLFFGRYVDAIFPISHFLQNKSNRFGKPTILLPVLGNYKTYVPQKIEPRFTYCADAGYLLRNMIILHAFKILNRTHREIKLLLVLFGTSDDMLAVQRSICDLCLNNYITILSNISQRDLECAYATSIGLLIPLNPNSLQDVARFSQKIAEYVASGRPIITSNVGEIPYYFEDKRNAMVADYTPLAYAKTMEWLIDNPDMANVIGRRGYEIGLANFDYLKNGEKIKDFLMKSFKERIM